MEQIAFDFIDNQQIRRIVERDFKELIELSVNKNSKSVIIISGGILESILIDALVFNKEFDLNKACKGGNHNGNKLNFSTYIKLAKEKNILSEEHLPNIIRDYRNLVHPGKEIREDIQFDDNEASLAFHALINVIKKLKKWYEKERNLREIEEKVMQCSEEEKEFLSLFTSPKPIQSNQPEHPWLECEVYGSKFDLERKNILKESEKGKCNILLETIPFIEKLLNKKIQRTSLTIDLKNVAAKNVGGTGASNRMLTKFS